MDLDPRYFVLKVEDVNNAQASMQISPFDVSRLRMIAGAVAQERTARGKAPFNAIVIESDWPEYAPTVAAINRRINGQPSPEPIGEVVLGEVDSVGFYPDARVICLHEQADWEHLPNGTKLYLEPQKPQLTPEAIQSLVDVPAVDAALRNFYEDATNDNAFCLVRTILDHYLSDNKEA